ncbi:unnamed protein product [Mucor hiemalis]
MSFSLYGALPPSKADKESEKSENTNTVKSGGLYSSLPPPEVGSSAFQKADSNDTASPSTTITTTTTTITPATIPTTTPAQPTGWSAYNKFRPVMRRPTIQAKPKLNKPFIPAGATIVSTKTITKEERENQQLAAAEEIKQKKLASETQAKADNIDLGAIPFLTSADDVNGFRSIQKSKKKGKKGKAAINNAQPLPTVFNMLEDYDPHKPNDYEQYKEERKELREKEKKKREWEKQVAHHILLDILEPQVLNVSREARPPPVQAPIVNEPPKVNIRESAEEAYQRRMMMSQQRTAPEPPKSSTMKTDDVNPAQEIAQKILAKYGLKEGSNEDGAGRINNISTPTKSFSTEKPSHVILLTNMVGPGEVDDMLQEETADECSKYGKVERCLIFEVPHGKIHNDKAVRIFVKFTEIESARRAIQDLNGRFFGGRVVTASFFDNGRFDRLDLAPTQEEFYR